MVRWEDLVSVGETEILVFTLGGGGRDQEGSRHWWQEGKYRRKNRPILGRDKLRLYSSLVKSLGFIVGGLNSSADGHFLSCVSLGKLLQCL